MLQKISEKGIVYLIVVYAERQTALFLVAAPNMIPIRCICYI
jgi:hypothetical protein